MLLRMTLAIVDVRCSVRVENSRGSAGLGRLRAHATGVVGRRHQSRSVVVVGVVVVKMCYVWRRYWPALATRVVDGEGGGGAAPLYQDASESRERRAAVTRRYAGSASLGGGCSVGLERKDGYATGEGSSFERCKAGRSADGSRRA